MTPPQITTIEQLHEYLYHAMQLEHGTIPVYLTTLYSLHPGSNSDARHIIRTVAVEEMLHLSLAANVLNAVGGTPDLTKPDFVPPFPAYLPDGETDFQVDLQPFSRDAVTMFLNIERPDQPADEESRLRPRNRPQRQLRADGPEEFMMQFYSIGDFYAEIARGVRYLHQQYEEGGRQLFTGDPSRQVTQEYFYSGGGELTAVTDLDSAMAAFRLISEQGEGYGGGIYDNEKELSHYYRFQQLQLGRYYQKGDQVGQPTGPPLDIDWGAVYPVMRNARLADYPQGSELYAAARKFNESYADFLGFLTQAYNGHPELLIEAVWRMFEIREDISRLMHNPVPQRHGVYGAPTFEVGNLAKGAGS